MKREIVFRGQKKNSEEWLYGDLLHRDGSVYILPVDAPDSMDNYEVKPETVGQYTGLKDKNGKKIFEGDIMKEFEGTKGEWKIKVNGILQNIVVNTAILSVVVPHHVGREEAEANARLMAAAPELLKALQDAVQNINTIAANTDHAEGFFNAMMNAVSACDRYEKIITKALEG